MKIEYYNGCTSSHISIDDVCIDEENFDRDKLLELATLILKSMDQSTLEYTIKELIQSNSRDYEDLGRCDQCGDYPAVYKIELLPP